MSFGQSIECWNWCWMSIFVIVIFFNYNQVLQFGAYSRYYKGASTQKRSYLVVCTTFRSVFHVDWKDQNKHSKLNSTINTLAKWHELHTNSEIMSNVSENISEFTWTHLTVHANAYNQALVLDIDVLSKEDQHWKRQQSSENLWPTWQNNQNWPTSTCED